MNKTFVAALLFLVCCNTKLTAQQYEKKTVLQGESLSALFYYRFPAFTDAKVKLKNGQELISKLNFNLLVCELQFISPNGDTLSIAKPQDLDFAEVGGSSFFYDKGYYEIFASTDSVKLVVLRKVTYTPIKIGAMGVHSQNGVGLQSYGSVIAQGVERKLTLNEDIDIIKETTYFLMTRSGEKTKASKSGFMKLFSYKNDAIASYLKANKISFDKEGDLKKLFDFCSSHP